MKRSRKTRPVGRTKKTPHIRPISRPKYRSQKSVFVDVDGTLVVNGALNKSVIDIIDKMRSDGFEIYLWSMAGRPHAISIAEHFGVAEMFDEIISKPGYMIDDDGFSWLRYVKKIMVPTSST
jgi:predicted HAD superfamily phosphohydrolase YqeG